MVKYRIGEKFHSVLLLFLLNKGWEMSTENDSEIDEDHAFNFSIQLHNPTFNNDHNKKEANHKHTSMRKLTSNFVPSRYTLPKH